MGWRNEWNMQEMKEAIGYARVSTYKQAEEGISLAAQQEKIRLWCLTNEYQLVGFFTDSGISGKKMDNRPSIQAAIHACKNATALVTYSLSRLTRSTKDLIQIAEQLEKKGVDLVSVSENIDTTTATGKMVFRMLGVMAEFERDIIGERTRLAMQSKKAKGEYTGGFVPYGFKLSENHKCLVKVLEEQKIIALAKIYRREGKTLESISEELFKHGALSRNNKKFTPYQISRILGYKH